MTNEVNLDAEESNSIEKTASEQTEAISTPEAAPAVETAAAAPEMTAEAPVEASTEAPTDAATETPVAQPEASAPAEAPVAEAASEPTPAEAPVAEAVTEPATAETPVADAVTAPASAAPEPPVTAPAAPAGEESQAPNEIDFGAILEQFEADKADFENGELVNGTVVGVNERGVLIDFGHKSEGFVPLEEFTGPDGEITANRGDKVEVVIRSMHSSEGAPLLSRIDALGRKVWDELETAFREERPVTGRVVDKTKGGLRLDLNGIEAFLPGSQIDSRPIRGLDSYIGEDIEARIIKFSKRRNNIVLSRKIITDEVVNAQKAETMANVDVGFIVDGTIKNLTEYGAFVDIGGIDGLLHVTDMSWGRIQHPSDKFSPGEHLQVKILKLDREKEKVSLGYKQLQPDPWSTVVEVYPVNTKLNGTVSSVTDYGVFVELESGVEGLVHVSEISWSRRAQSPKRMFQKGQQVEVQVLGVDTVERRISLGMKQFQDNPWETVDLRYPVGSRVQGRVRNLTDFGAFVELEEGIDGLVHVSDITWAKKIKHPKDILAKDQEIEAIVTNIDKRGQRLSLSMKDLTPSAWETFVATHRPGDVVKGTVSRFTNFGVFVELGEGLEGLCHISELSDERVERPESVAELGQELDFKILRIEPGDQKIGLSRRAVGKDDEPVVDTRIYSTEAKGGMASLGELANLKFGGDTAPAEEAPKKKAKAKKETAKEPVNEVAAEEPATEAVAAAEEIPTAETPAEEDPASEAEPAAEAVAESAVEETPAAAAPADEVPEAEPVAEAVAEAAVEEAPAGEEPAEETPAAEAEPAAEVVAEPIVEDTPAPEATESTVEAAEAADTPTAEEPEAAEATDAPAAEIEAAAEDAETKAAEGAN